MVPNSEALRAIPETPKTVRGETWINCGIIERNLETQKLSYKLLIQCDLKVKLPDFVINTFMPKATKGFYNDVVKYYQKNHKTI